MNPIVSYISPQWWRINTYKHCMNNVLPSVTKKLKIREEKYTTECCEVGLQKDFHEKIFNHLWAILCLIPSMFEVVTTLCTLIRVQLDNVDNMKSHLEKSSITLITGSWRSTYHLFDCFSFQECYSTHVYNSLLYWVMHPSPVTYHTSPNQFWIIALLISNSKNTKRTDEKFHFFHQNLILICTVPHLAVLRRAPYELNY